MDLLIARKHVYNCNRLFKAADHIHHTCGCENMYTVHTRENTETV